jgi:hypothetical protein
MALDFNNVLQAMLQAAANEVGETWPQARQLVEDALRNLANVVVQAGNGVADGADPDEARELIADAIRGVEGASAAVVIAGQAAKQRIANAALAAVRQTVNTAAGLAII